MILSQCDKQNGLEKIDALGVFKSSFRVSTDTQILSSRVRSEELSRKQELFFEYPMFHIWIPRLCIANAHCWIILTIILKLAEPGEKRFSAET
eukprot:UN04501